MLPVVAMAVLVALAMVEGEALWTSVASSLAGLASTEGVGAHRAREWMEATKVATKVVMGARGARAGAVVATAGPAVSVSPRGPNRPQRRSCEGSPTALPVACPLVAAPPQQWRHPRQTP